MQPREPSMTVTTSRLHSRDNCTQELASMSPNCATPTTLTLQANCRILLSSQHDEAVLWSCCCWPARRHGCAEARGRLALDNCRNSNYNHVRESFRVIKHFWNHARFKSVSAAVDTTAKAKLVSKHEARLHKNGAVTQALLGRWVFSILYPDVDKYGFRSLYSCIVELSTRS